MTTSRDREQLINGHLYIADVEASKGSRRTHGLVAKEDLYGVGVIGLMRAAERFDPARGVLFKTLATTYVRGEIGHEIRRLRRLGMYSVPAQTTPDVRSLDELKPAGLTSDGDTLLESLVDESADTADLVVSRFEAGAVEEALRALPPDYAAAVRLVYGEGLSWDAFGQDRGWTSRQTKRFARRFRSDIADRLRAHRAVAEMVSGGTVRLPLFGDATALLDAIDAERLERFRWLMDARGFGYRMETQRRHRVRILLHHAVVGAVPEGHRVVALNRDRLDCRRQNLVVVPRWQAYHGQTARNRTGLKGIRLHAFSGKWCAEITVNGTVHHLGSFGSPKAAALAYDEAARKYLGELAVLNFPKEPVHAL